MLSVLSNEASMTASKEKSQLDRFKEAARQLKTDDNETRFSEKLGKLVKQKKDIKKNIKKND